MRVAALYDIHGNLPALEAVLAEVRAAVVDLVLIGGDVVPGPMVREAMDLLLGLELPVEAILGNSEVTVLAAMRGDDPGPMPAAAVEAVVWSASQLTEAQAGQIASWPKVRRMRVDHLGSMLFCHGTPRHENEIFTRLTPEEKLLPLFRDAGADIVICGHTHMQFDRMIGDLRVVNAGSVGMPFGRTGADWLLLTPDGIEFRHTEFDLEAAARRIRSTSYPQAEHFAAQNVLTAPAEAAMLEVLGRAELRYRPEF